MDEETKSFIQEEFNSLKRELAGEIGGLAGSIDVLDEKLSNFIKFYLLTWANVQERQVELQQAQDELKKAVGL